MYLILSTKSLIGKTCFDIRQKELRYVPYYKLSTQCLWKTHTKMLSHRTSFRRNHLNTPSPYTYVPYPSPSQIHVDTKRFNLITYSDSVNLSSFINKRNILLYELNFFLAILILFSVQRQRIVKYFEVSILQKDGNSANMSITNRPVYSRMLGCFLPLDLYDPVPNNGSHYTWNPLSKYCPRPTSYNPRTRFQVVRHNLC